MLSPAIKILPEHFHPMSEGGRSIVALAGRVFMILSSVMCCTGWQVCDYGPFSKEFIQDFFGLPWSLWPSIVPSVAVLDKKCWGEIYPCLVGFQYQSESKSFCLLQVVWSVLSHSLMLLVWNAKKLPAALAVKCKVCFLQICWECPALTCVQMEDTCGDLKQKAAWVGFLDDVEFWLGSCGYVKLCFDFSLLSCPLCAVFVPLL